MPTANPTEDVLTQLTAVIHEVAGTDVAAITPEASLIDDLGVDSLSMVEIIYAIEDNFGLSIPEEDSKDLITVGDAVAYVKKALQTQPA
jgi:acyl carrier protein